MIHPANAPQDGAHDFVRNCYSRAETHDLTTSDVESATVYGRNDETIGSIVSIRRRPQRGQRTRSRSISMSSCRFSIPNGENAMTLSSPGP